MGTTADRVRDQLEAMGIDVTDEMLNHAMNMSERERYTTALNVVNGFVTSARDLLTVVPDPNVVAKSIVMALRTRKMPAEIAYGLASLAIVELAKREVK